MNKLLKSTLTLAGVVLSLNASALTFKCDVSVSEGIISGQDGAQVTNTQQKSIIINLPNEGGELDFTVGEKQATIYVEKRASSAKSDKYKIELTAKDSNHNKFTSSVVNSNIDKTSNQTLGLTLQSSSGAFEQLLCVLTEIGK